MSSPHLQLLETDGAEDDFREQNQAPLLLPGISGRWRHHSSVTAKMRACGPPALLQLQLQRWAMLVQQTPEVTDTSARAPSMLPVPILDRRNSLEVCPPLGTYPASNEVRCFLR